jgi:hypothetical protein
LGDLHGPGLRESAQVSATAAPGAGAVVLVGTAVAVASLVVLHIVPPGLSPVRNAVSHYGITRYRAWYRALTISMAVAGFAAAVGLAIGLRGNAGVVAALVVIFAISRAVISWFPMDEPDTPRTPTGSAHGILAIITFTAITLAALRLSQLLDRTGQWGSTAPALCGLAWFLIAGLAAMIFTGRVAQRKGFFGAAERGFYLGTLAWLAVVGAMLI